MTSTTISSHSLASSSSPPPQPNSKLLLPANIHHETFNHSATCFIDSGADANFADSAFISNLQIQTIPLTHPILLLLADGGPAPSGPITHETIPLQLHIGDHIETTTFLITNLSHPIILGLPWLRAHNPTIQWSNNIVTFNSPDCIINCCPVPVTIHPLSSTSTSSTSILVPIPPVSSSSPSSSASPSSPRALPLVSSNLVPLSSTSTSSTSIIVPVPPVSPSLSSYSASQSSPRALPLVSSNLVPLSSTSTSSTSILVPVPPVSSSLSSSSASPSSPRTHASHVLPHVPPSPDPVSPPTTAIQTHNLISSECANGLGGFISHDVNGELAFTSISEISEQAYPFFSDPLAQPPQLEPDLDMPAGFLDDFAHIFEAEGNATLPAHRPQDCTIELLPGSAPPYSKVYNMTVEEDTVLRDWLKQNISTSFIRPSSSPYGAPCFFVKQKGKLRLCMDYRGLNKQTRKDRFPIPLISDLLRSLSSGTVFSALDLKGAYQHLRIKEGQEHMTSFLTKYGQFEFLVMPFGLANAPAAFQRFMNDLFRNKNFVLVYLDDIIIFSEKDEDHWAHVREVLQILSDNKLYCAKEKCHFGKRQIAYLGYIVSNKGVLMDPAKVKTVQDWPIPTTVKEIQIFLGFANFYRRLIPNFASLSRPITQLLQDPSKFQSSSFPVAAFNAIKATFASPELLAHPNELKPFLVETDASDFALAGALSQYDANNVLRPIAFYSRQLDKYERNYEIYDKELLAIFACFKEWRHFLQGGHHPVTVLSDHKNLSYFMSTKHLTRRQARWSLFFNEFNFTLTHRPGSRSGKVDFVSRRPDYYVPNDPANFIQLLNPSSLSAVDHSLLHRITGHVNDNTLSKTYKAVTGLPRPGPRPRTICPDCALSKSTRNNIPQTGSHPHHLLEVIESDTQGPFPVLAHDGTNNNVKFVDAKSGYVKMETIPDRTAATILAAFTRFKSRMELRTNKKIKIVRTDAGTEYQGVFQDYLVQHGITKQKGFAYEHTHPGKAERAHQSILHLGRANLRSSQLPPMFYSDAQLYSTYIYNRTVHGQHSTTPFQQIYGFQPDLSNLHSFGCLAYAHIPQERRTKLADSAERCRLLGFLDDDDSEELLGYKLLRESDLAIIHCKDVRFDEHAPLQPLPHPHLYSDNFSADPVHRDPDFAPSSPAIATPSTRTLRPRQRPRT